MRVFSTRQSTSSGSSVSLICFTTVPFFTVNWVPFTFKLLVTTTESPSFSGFPLQSFTSILIFCYTKTKLNQFSRITYCAGTRPPRQTKHVLSDQENNILRFPLTLQRDYRPPLLHA